MPTGDDSASALHEIIDRLSALSAIDPLPKITATTELYNDLSIYGDDLDEFVGWVADRYQVDFSHAKFSRYGPSEGGVGLLEMFGIVSRRKFEGLPVQKFLNAIATGVWRD